MVSASVQSADRCLGGQAILITIMLLPCAACALALLSTSRAWQLTVYSSSTCANDRVNDFISLPDEDTGCTVHDWQDYYGSPGDFGDCTVDIYQAGGNQKTGCDDPKYKLFTLTASDQGKCRSYGAAGYYKATCGERPSVCTDPQTLSRDFWTPLALLALLSFQQDCNKQQLSGQLVQVIETTVQVKMPEAAACTSIPAFWGALCILTHCMF